MKVPRLEPSGYRRRSGCCTASPTASSRTGGPVTISGTVRVVAELEAAAG